MADSLIDMQYKLALADRLDYQGMGDVDLLDVGNGIDICGALYSGKGRLYLMLFPGEEKSTAVNVLTILKLTSEEWERWLHQTDVLDSRGPGKAILRKSQRQIDRRVQWSVFERDDFRCRYCGQREPLTVDHVILWEQGGATVPDNLISACSRCNKLRGNREYQEWLGSRDYGRVSLGLSPEKRTANERVVGHLERLRAIQTKPRSR